MDARLSANDDDRATHEAGESHARPFRPARILCATDFSAGGERAVESAARLAELYEASLDLLHVWSSPMSGSGHAAIGHHSDALHAALAAALAGIARPRSYLRTHLVNGEAWKEITEIARQTSADLIVLGTTGASGAASAQGLGTVAQRVLERASVPVLLV